MKERLFLREDPTQIATRAAPAVPNTWNAQTRSVRVTAASESPVMVWDWERGDVVPEVLLMSGARLPANGQVPVLDAHNRYTVEAILGSARDFKPSGGQMDAEIHFSDTPEGQRAGQKMQEGHLTDVSVGYTADDSVWVPDGERAIIDGREFTGPLKVTRAWTLKELSLAPIGADATAKARAERQVPATQKQTSQKGGFRMNPELKKLLIGRGLAAEATDEEALAFLTRLSAEDQLKLRQEAGLESAPTAVNPGALVIGSPTNVIDINAVRTSRDQEIVQMREACELGGCPDLFVDFVGRGLTIDQARAEIFNKMAQTRKPVGTGVSASIQVDERDKFRSAATDSLLIRGNFQDKPAPGGAVWQPSPGAQDLRGFSLKELARECLMKAGRPRGGDSLDMVGRALTVTDLPNILAATANKFLYAGYALYDETWRVWCATGSLPDFKNATINRASETDDLDLIPEGKEYKYSGMTDLKETTALGTYGKKFAITRQTIINDDLGALTTIPQKHGAAAARKIGDLPYAVLTANAAMGDGVTLFHANHGNVMSSLAPGLTSLAEGVKLMKLQKDIGGKQPLNIRAEFFIGPAAYEGTMEQFFNSGQIGGATATDAGRAMLINPYGGTRFTRVYEARLDTSSSTHWYLAGPKGRTIVVYFLDGIETPYLEQQLGWDVDGMEYKVRIDAVAKALDWKALAYNAI